MDRDALDAPIGLTRALTGRVQPNDKVAIVVSDSFRQTRADLMLPPLLDALNARGVAERDIDLLVATGTHRPPTESGRPCSLWKYRMNSRAMGVNTAHQKSNT